MDPGDAGTRGVNPGENDGLTVSPSGIHGIWDWKMLIGWWYWRKLANLGLQTTKTDDVWEIKEQQW